MPPLKLPDAGSGGGGKALEAGVTGFKVLGAAVGGGAIDGELKLGCMTDGENGDGATGGFVVDPGGLNKGVVCCADPYIGLR